MEQVGHFDFARTRGQGDGLDDRGSRQLVTSLMRGIDVVCALSHAIDYQTGSISIHHWLRQQSIERHWYGRTSARSRAEDVGIGGTSDGAERCQGARDACQYVYAGCVGLVGRTEQSPDVVMVDARVGPAGWGNWREAMVIGNPF